MSSSSTDDVILEIRRQRAVLGQRLNAFVPAVNLPPEVLTTIFEFACCSIEDEIFKANIEKPSSKNDPDNASASTPLLIAKVCSAWRNVALSAAQLWTKVIIYYEDDRDENQAVMLKHWLSNSGERPLDVHVAQQGRSAYIKYTEVIDVLAEYGARLRGLDLFLPAEWKPAVIKIAACLPLLTHLTLRSPDFDHCARIERPDMFAKAPQLREVTLVRYSVADVSLPWSQLESLESGYGSVFKCIETLRLCQRLRRCIIKGVSKPWTSTQSSPLTHTMLEELEFSSHDEELLPELFNALELPGLRSFVLRLGLGAQWLSEWNLWLPSFLSPAAGTLEALTLPYPSPLEEFLVTLRSLPNLRKLVLLNAHWRGELTQKALDLLNPETYIASGCGGAVQLDSQGDEDRAGISGPDENSNSHCLLPNLETFQYEGPMDVTLHALVEFLLARWTGPVVSSGLEGQAGRGNASEPTPPRPSVLPATRLRSATFKMTTRIRFEDADAAVIKKLRLEGMHLEFWTPPDYWSRRVSLLDLDSI